jgi:riboflavin synthase
MFTGLVEEVGHIEGRTGRRLRIGAATVVEGAEVGDSIAVDGCCLTLVAMGEGWWEADLSEETLARTTLDRLGAGDRVNLERPLRLADRLGGHLVQGHVDGVGEIVAPAPHLTVRLPEGLDRYIVTKGSVTVDGVSLTVVELTGDTFSVAVVPHTATATTLASKGPGDPVNIEIDVVAKYVERLVAPL